jgi:peptide/nickel transport system substrate-binding protein
MNSLRQLRPLHLFSLVAVLALVLAACVPATAPGGAAAPAATEPAAEAAASSDLPAEPGRGTDGTLNILYWQAVTILNPYLSTGTKDYHAASLIMEPLIEFAPDGSILPVLVEEVPTVENGGISEDLTSITYKLLPDVVWSDGTPFTANDVVFTWQYCTDPATGCSSATPFTGVANVEAVDEQTVTITFEAPQPFPYTPFGGQLSPLIQQAQFADCIGARAQECSEQNNAPLGTGPYKVSDFSPGDVVVYVANENYRIPDKPHFAEVIFKGGGDAAAAARAALETGEVDYAWNLQVEPSILNEMAAQGNGMVVSAFSGNVERILINFTNPSADLGDLRSEWSAENPNPHPFLADMNVRMALSMAIDRGVIAEQLYGAAGQPTCNILSGPPAVVSTANDSCLTQDLAGAAQLLEENGWVDSNGDGVREKDGVELRILYQTSTNAVRQKTQALIQQWWQEIGVATELKNIDAGVFFGGDPASPDTLGKFYADVQMFTNGPDNTDPQTYLAGWLCDDGGRINVANSANQWLGNNTERWCSPEYDAKFAELRAATDPAQRAAIAIELNDMLAQNYVNLPLIFRASVSAHSNALGGVQINGWDTEEWNIEDWFRVRE